jgi:ArsR family transcriptional regulator, arsenate/arsenite/antimonite-responsive transcriptional repressor
LIKGGDDVDKTISFTDVSLTNTFNLYEKKFKALSDQKRLHILYEITQQGEVCVCDLSEKLHLPQSKLSYHLKILMDAQLIEKETRGTWSYYTLNHSEINHILSEELCCLFRRD